MAHKYASVNLSDEQVRAWYQHHIQILHGYALALGLKAGLTPAETARVFVEPWQANRAALPSDANVYLLGQQAGQVAEILALTYGAERVRFEQQNASWVVAVTILDCEPLERYGVSLEEYTQWVAEQLRLVCEPKGICCSVWLDQATLVVQLTV